MFSLCRSLLKSHEIHMQSKGVLPLPLLLLSRALCCRRCRASSACQVSAMAWAVPLHCQVTPVSEAGVKTDPFPRRSPKAGPGCDLGYASNDNFVILGKSAFPSHCFLYMYESPSTVPRNSVQARSDVGPAVLLSPPILICGCSSLLALGPL